MQRISHILYCITNPMLNMIYERLYLRLKENTPVQMGEHYGWEILRKRHADPKTRYNKFSTLTQCLFLLLDGMDLYTRYPMEGANYNNIKFLSRPEIHGACLQLGEMVGELISLVPLVWNKIECITDHQKKRSSNSVKYFFNAF